MIFQMILVILGSNFGVLLVHGFTGQPGCSLDGYCRRENGESLDVPCPDVNKKDAPYKSNKPPSVNKNAARYLAEICPSFIGQETCCNDD